MNEKFEVFVEELPKCQGVHADEIPDATYDAQIRGKSTWGYFCHRCFLIYAGRLGIGRGQRLVIKSVKAKEDWADEALTQVQCKAEIKELKGSLRKALAMQRAYNKVCPSGNALLDERVQVLQTALNALLSV